MPALIAAVPQQPKAPPGNQAFTVSSAACLRYLFYRSSNRSMLVIVEPYERPTPVEGTVTAPPQPPRYIDLELLIQQTRRSRMTIDIFDGYRHSFTCIVGSLRYQNIIPGRDFDQSRYLLRGFHPAFRIRILAYLRLLEPHHAVDKPWNLKTVVNSAKSLLKLTKENNSVIAPPGDGTFYSGEHSLFAFLARYTSAQEATESKALQAAMGDYMREEISLGRLEDVAEDEENAYQLLLKIHSVADTEVTCQPPPAAIKKSVIYYAPSHKRDSLDPPSQGAVSTMISSPSLPSLTGHSHNYIKPNTHPSTHISSDIDGHRSPLLNQERRTASFRNSTPIYRSGECAFCSWRDGHKVINCPVAEEYIARGLCFRDPVYHHLNFPDGTRLTRQAPGANFRKSVDMWHARQDGAQGGGSVIAPHHMTNAHEIDNRRGTSFGLEHGAALRTNKMVSTAATTGKFGTSTTSRSATSTPPRVFSSLGMSVVGGY